jgi:hypothetical protein
VDGVGGGSDNGRNKIAAVGGMNGMVESFHIEFQ